MITEQDLQEAIAECEGQRNPNSNTCIKLAAYYTIRDHLFGGDKIDHPSYSLAPDPVIRYPELKYNSDTEFFNLVKDMSIDEIMSLTDEIMDTLKVINPKMYNNIIRRLL